MRHATAEALSSLEPLFQKLRLLPQLNEKKVGVFYLKSRAFLHFHEDDGAIFADVRLQEKDFTRLPATTKSDQTLLIKAIREYLA